MRVVIDATFARRAPLTGTGVYIRKLIEALREEGSVEIVEAVNARRRTPSGGGLGSVVNLGGDLWWSCVELPLRARRVGAAVIHHPLPAVAPLAGVPQVITVADLAFELLPECFAPGFRAYARLTHRFAAGRAAGVICVSDSTAADVRRLWGIPTERITVAPHGPGQDLPDSAGSSVPRHFLYVGDNEPRKNVGALLAAYGLYRQSVASPLELVLAGSAEAGVPGVRAVFRPDSARLGELYRGAVALVHPSLHEGFGLTPLEAMRLGVPVIAGPAAGVREVCGDAARYADARDPSALAVAMTEVASSDPLRADLIVRGRARAATFSWARCARAHLAAYSLALTRP